MAKIDVTLAAALNNGKEVLRPGETVSMDETQAVKLAALGMVKLPGKAKRNGKSGVGRKAAKPAVNPEKALDAGEESEDDADSGEAA
jgi:hypothetical protein